MTYVVPQKINCANIAVGFGICCPNCSVKFFIDKKDCKIFSKDKTVVGAKCPSCKKKIKVQDFMELREGDIGGIRYFYENPAIIYNEKRWIPFGWINNYDFFLYDRRICRKIGYELALDVFEDMEFPISDSDKVISLYRDDTEVDC